MPPSNAPRKSRKLAGLVTAGIVVLIFVGVFYFAPVVLDKTPPVLDVSGLEADQRYRGSLTIHITAKDEKAGLATLTVQVDDGSVNPLSFVEGDSTFWTLDTATFPDGLHEVNVVATDRAWKKNVTTHTVPFFIDSTPPQLQLLTESQQVGQGRTLAIFIGSDELVSEMTGQLFDQSVTFYPTSVGNLYRGLVGVPVKQAIKTYPLIVQATDLIGNSTSKAFQIKVGKTEFLSGGLIKLTPQQQQTMMDPSKREEDNRKRAAAYAMADKESNQLWGETFIQPTEGVVSSPFGKYREYNTGTRSHHLGTDIANAEGTPVYAGNSGVVSLAEALHIYGNTVIINHGQGVSTSYNHLSEIHVKAGDTVSKGQRIGLMGATGQATGPHLHWGMVVNGVSVAPEEWVERDFSPPARGGE